MKRGRLVALALAALCASLFLHSVAMGAVADPPVHVVVDGRYLGFDVAPRIQDGRVLVPWRWLMEFYGFAVDYREADQSISTSGNGRVIEMRIGYPEARINGATVQLDVPPMVEEGRVLVPLRFISEALGYTVDWNGDMRTVTVMGHGAAPAPAPALTLGEITQLSRNTVRFSPVLYDTLLPSDPADYQRIDAMVAAWQAAMPAVHPDMQMPVPPYGTIMSAEAGEDSALAALAWHCNTEPDGSRGCTNDDDGYVYLTRSGSGTWELFYAPDLAYFINTWPYTMRETE